MKNILLVITKGEIGGAQLFVATLAKILHRQGHTVTVACGEGDFLRDTLTPKGISVVRFDSLRRTKNPFVNLRFAWDMKNFLTAHSFDAVHFNSSNSLFGALGARLLRPRPKIIFTLHGLSLIDPNYAASRLMKQLYRLLFKCMLLLVDEAVFVNKANFAYAKQVRLLRHGAVIPNGIDTHGLRFLSRNEARTALAQKIATDISNAYIIGSVGRLAYPKNYEFIIDAFPDILREIPDAIAIIIGEGPERETYLRMIGRRKLADKIFLAGKLIHAYQYMKAFDLFTLPSEYEGMSMTLIEALFAEVPILASRVGGTPELLDNDAWMYVPDNKTEFIEKLKSIRARKDFAYSEAQKNHRAQFEGEAMANAYLKLY